MKVTFDRRGYERKIRQFAALQRRDLGPVIHEEAKFVIEECLRRTPPMNGKTLKGGGQADGNKAVKRDVGKLFKQASSLRIWLQNPRFASYSPDIQTKLLNQMLGKTKRFRGVDETPDPYFHQTQRSRRGFVPRKSLWRVVLKEGSVKTYTTKLSRRVGIARAGWKKGAMVFGAKIPGWVGRHTAPGHALDNTRNTLTPIAESGNNVRYVQAAGRDLGIIKAALLSRQKSVENKVRRITEKSFLESNV